MAELERSTLSPWIRHRRTAARGALLLSGAALAGFAGALLAPGADTTVIQPVRQETHIVQVATPVAALAAPAEPVAVESDDRCPEPPAYSEKRAGFAAGREVDVYEYRLGEADLRGVAASATRPEMLATWSEASIYLSTDDGRTFSRVLDGPGDVAAVAFDCRDRVYAWRTGLGLGVRDGAGESWRPLEVFDLDALADAHEEWGKRIHLAVNGDTVAAAGPARGRGDQGLVAVTHDAGASWRFADLDYYDHIAGLEVAADGSVFVAADWSDCMIEGTNAFTIPSGPGEVQPTKLGDWGLSAVGADRTVYSFGADCDAALCARGPDDAAWRCVRGLPEDADLEFVPATGGLRVRANGRVYALEGRRASRLNRIDDDVDLIDSAGRALWLDAGALHRRSTRYGERILLGQRETRTW